MPNLSSEKLDHFYTRGHIILHDCFSRDAKRGITKRVSDVVLLHPLVLHTVSQHHNGTARMITNPPVHLKEPMNFQRADKNYSPVEGSILRALEFNPSDFTPQNPRERIVPERVCHQAKMKEEELARLQQVAGW